MSIKFDSDAEHDERDEEVKIMEKTNRVMTNMPPLCASPAVCTRSRTETGVTSCCYIAQRLLLIRYVFNKYYPDMVDEQRSILEYQLYQLITTSLNHGSLINIVPNQGSLSLRCAIQKHATNEEYGIKLINNLDWLYQAFTGQFVETVGNKNTKSYKGILSPDDIGNMFDRSWEYPIPFGLMSNGEVDHWFIIHCGKILSAWGTGNARINVHFSVEPVTIPEFTSFIQSISTPSSEGQFEVFKLFLMQTMLNFKNASSSETTAETISEYIDKYNPAFFSGVVDVREICDGTDPVVQILLETVQYLSYCKLLLGPFANKADTHSDDEPDVVSHAYDSQSQYVEQVVAAPQLTVTASLVFDETHKTPEFYSSRHSEQPFTRSRCEMIRNFGMTPSCHVVKTYQLIFIAMDRCGINLDEKSHQYAHSIIELLYAELSYGLSIQLLTDQSGSLLNTIQTRFESYNSKRTQYNAEEFIDALIYLQAFAVINRPERNHDFDQRLQPVTQDNIPDVWGRMQQDKEYFILFAGNPDDPLERMYAAHYFICGVSESETVGARAPVVKIYSAWGSENVKNAFASNNLSLKDFNKFVGSILNHRPGTNNPDLRSFLTSTMLCTENEKCGIGTVKTSDVKQGTREYIEAGSKIDAEINKLLGKKLTLVTVPNYLSTLTSVIEIMVKVNLLKTRPNMKQPSRAAVNYDVISQSALAASKLSADNSEQCSSDVYEVGSDLTVEDFDGGRPRRNKITRRLRRHIRGKTMKKYRNNKRRANKVQTQRMVKRKKTKTTKLLRRHIVKK
jgi:hypothetical protein